MPDDQTMGSPYGCQADLSEPIAQALRDLEVPARDSMPSAGCLLRLMPMSRFLSDSCKRFAAGKDHGGDAVEPSQDHDFGLR